MQVLSMKAKLAEAKLAHAVRMQHAMDMSSAGRVS
jgi:hypothetical protein